MAVYAWQITTPELRILSLRMRSRGSHGSCGARSPSVAFDSHLAFVNSSSTLRARRSVIHCRSGGSSQLFPTHARTTPPPPPLICTCARGFIPTDIPHVLTVFTAWRARLHTHGYITRRAVPCRRFGAGRRGVVVGRKINPNMAELMRSPAEIEADVCDT